VRETLIADALFFQEMRLIDYSLLVVKVDWRQVERTMSRNEL
jgi:hypothetical protein